MTTLEQKIKAFYGKMQRWILGFFPNSKFYGRQIIPILWRFAHFSEARYWKLKIKQLYTEEPEYIKNITNPDREIDSFFTSMIDHDDVSHVRILDVGSGPLPIIPKNWEGKVVHVIAIDPLAKEYSRILRKYHINPPVKATFGEAERLLNFFPKNFFDFIYAANSIDHGYNPMKAIRNMIEVAKPGATIYMEHYTNEAENENYAGMHQWNFDTEDGVFYIWNLREKHDITRMFNEIATTECTITNNDIIKVHIKKRPE
jgi:SAM-dependent methyltransferase